MQYCNMYVFQFIPYWGRIEPKFFFIKVSSLDDKNRPSYCFVWNNNCKIDIMVEFIFIGFVRQPQKKNKRGGWDVFCVLEMFKNFDLKKHLFLCETFFNILVSSEVEQSLLNIQGDSRIVFDLFKKI